jgi:hypothetical protein
VATLYNPVILNFSLRLHGDGKVPKIALVALHAEALDDSQCDDEASDSLGALLRLSRLDMQDSGSLPS